MNTTDIHRPCGTQETQANLKLDLYFSIMSRGYAAAQAIAIRHWQTLSLQEKLDIQIAASSLWPNDLKQSEHQAISFLVYDWAAASRRTLA